MHLFLIQRLPEKIPRKEQTQNPVFWEKRFRADGGGSTAGAQLGEGPWGTAQSLLPALAGQEPVPRGGVILSSTAHGLGGEKQRRERHRDSGGGGQAPSHSTPTQPSHNKPLRGSHHPRRKCVCGVFDLRTCTSLCATAVAMPQGPRATPGKPQEWGQDMRPQPGPCRLSKHFHAKHTTEK